MCLMPEGLLQTTTSSVRILLLLGGVLRFILTVYGLWQDANFSVHYTDIDYTVVMDAAAAISNGGSPFERATYRYTPLLAWIMLPNILLHVAFGKFLFCVADLVAGWLIVKLLRRDRVSNDHVCIALVAWLFNPFTMAISTRGSGESLVVVQLLATLLFLRQGRIKTAGAMFGLAVHWRIYPVIYVFPVAVNFIVKSDRFQDVQRRARSGTALTLSSRILTAIFNTDLLTFGMSSLAVLVGLGLLFFQMYGHEFLQEAYLYHGVRRDPRHNFSSVYYPVYLSIMEPHATTWLQRLVSVAQLIAVVALGWQHAMQLPAAWLLQTLAFVSLNKVVTAQYFVWYFSLLPLVLPRLLESSPKAKRHTMLASGMWLIAVANWLGWAYMLEFLGMQVHLAVWGAGTAFMATNVGLICVLNQSLTSRESIAAIKAE